MGEAPSIRTQLKIKICPKAKEKVRSVRLELTASRLKGGCSTTELRALILQKEPKNSWGLTPTNIFYKN